MCLPVFSRVYLRMQMTEKADENIGRPADRRLSVHEVSVYLHWCVCVCVRERVCVCVCERKCLYPACVTRLTIYDMYYVNIGAKTVRRS